MCNLYFTLFLIVSNKNCLLLSLMYLSARDLLRSSCTTSVALSRKKQGFRCSSTKSSTFSKFLLCRKKVLDWPQKKMMFPRSMSTECGGCGKSSHPNTCNFFALALQYSDKRCLARIQCYYRLINRVIYQLWPTRILPI